MGGGLGLGERGGGEGGSRSEERGCGWVWARHWVQSDERLHGEMMKGGLRGSRVGQDR